MNKQDLIDLLATSPKHAAKLRSFKKAELENFVAAQTDPANHEEFPIGSFVYCEWAGSYGIVTHTEEIPGSRRDLFGLTVKTGPSGRLDTNSNDVIRAA